jgi:hypothetical protein
MHAKKTRALPANGGGRRITRLFLAVAELEVGVRARLAEARLGHAGAIHVDPILSLQLIPRVAAMGAGHGLGGGRRRQRCAEKSQGKKLFHRMYSFIIFIVRRSGVRGCRTLEEARGDYVTPGSLAAIPDRQV